MAVTHHRSDTAVRPPHVSHLSKGEVTTAASEVHAVTLHPCLQVGPGPTPQVAGFAPHVTVRTGALRQSGEADGSVSKGQAKVSGQPVQTHKGRTGQDLTNLVQPRAQAACKSKVLPRQYTTITGRQRRRKWTKRTSRESRRRETHRNTENEDRDREQWICDINSSQKIEQPPFKINDTIFNYPQSTVKTVNILFSLDIEVNNLWEFLKYHKDSKLSTKTSPFVPRNGE